MFGEEKKGITNPMLEACANSTTEHRLESIGELQAGDNIKETSSARAMATSRWFSRVELLLLLLTVVSLAIDSPAMPPGRMGQLLVNVIEMVTNVTWTVQLAIKVIAVGPKMYCVSAQGTKVLNFVGVSI